MEIREVFVRRIAGDGPCQMLQCASIHRGGVVSLGFVLAHTPVAGRKAAYTRASTVSEQCGIPSGAAKVLCL